MMLKGVFVVIAVLLAAYAAQQWYQNYLRKSALILLHTKGRLVASDLTIRNIPDFRKFSANILCVTFFWMSDLPSVFFLILPVCSPEREHGLPVIGVLVRS